VVADLDSEAACKKMVEETVAAFGAIDVLVLNAGKVVY
jgi:NAD(P)-dependent dehydrogenase (short-subunit alcohol dehydrogenase family)